MTPKKQTADIPVLKKKKGERRGGAVPLGAAQQSGGGGVLYRWFGFGSPGAAAGGAAVVGKAAGARLGLIPTFVNMLGSGAAPGILTAVITAGAVLALYSMGAKDGGPLSGKVFPSAQREAPAETDAVSVEPSSLNVFMGANQGKAYEADAVAQMAEDVAAAEDEIVPEDEIGGPGKDAETGGAPEMAEVMAKAAKPKMIASKKFGDSRRLQGGIGLLAGGQGLSGGMIRKFEKDKFKARPLNLSKKPRKARVRRASKSISRISGKGAMGQLKFANRRSVGALGQGSGEGQAYESAEAFTSAPAGSGGSIGAAGVTTGDGGVGSSPNDGGPVSVGGTPQSNQGAPGTGAPEDKSPWTDMVMMAAALLTAASTIITIIGIMAMIQKLAPNPAIAAFLENYKTMLLGVATGMAAAATVMGVMIMSQYGQPEQGMILTAGGAITTAAGLASMIWPEAVQPWMQVIAGVAGIAASVGSMLSMNNVK